MDDILEGGFLQEVFSTKKNVKMWKTRLLDFISVDSSYVKLVRTLSDYIVVLLIKVHNGSKKKIH